MILWVRSVVASQKFLAAHFLHKKLHSNVFVNKTRQLICPIRGNILL